MRASRRSFAIDEQITTQEVDIVEPAENDITDKRMARDSLLSNETSAEHTQLDQTEEHCVVPDFSKNRPTSGRTKTSRTRRMTNQIKKWTQTAQ